MLVVAKNWWLDAQANPWWLLVGGATLGGLWVSVGYGFGRTVKSMGRFWVDLAGAGRLVVVVFQCQNSAVWLLWGLIGFLKKIYFVLVFLSVKCPLFLNSAVLFVFGFPFFFLLFLVDYVAGL